MKYPWEDLVPLEEQNLYATAGFGKKLRIGRRPALLVIDVQYRTVGHKPLPLASAINEYVTSCGEHGWSAVPYIQRILNAFRERRLPVFYPHVALKSAVSGGRFADKLPQVLNIPEEAYAFVCEVEPEPGEVLIPKNHPSAFFGTPLASYLVDQAVDSVVVTGCTTSGCVRSSVVDAFSYNYPAVVPFECVYDRSQTSHAINLFDIANKYGDVVSTDEALRLVANL